MSDINSLAMPGFLFVLLADRRGLLLPRLIAVCAVALFLAYTASPIQLIPQHTPVFGYVDDVCILIFGFLIARRLTPEQLFAGAEAGGYPVQRGMIADVDNDRPAGVSLYDLLGYRRAWQIQVFFRPQPVSTAPIIVVGGSGRSGTTLLRTMLNRHPAIYCGDESTIFLKRISSVHDIAQRYQFDTDTVADMFRSSHSQAEFIDLFRQSCLRRSGKSVWAEKTPDNVLRFDYVRRHFPNAMLIHMIRDGRDVVCSLRRQTWLKVEPDERRTLDAVGVAIDYWVKHVQAGLRFRDDPHYVELRYEDLVSDPEGTLRPILAVAGLDWSPALFELQHGRDATKPHENEINTNALNQWRRELSPQEIEVIEAKAGPLLPVAWLRRLGGFFFPSAGSFCRPLISRR